VVPILWTGKRKQNPPPSKRFSLHPETHEYCPVSCGPDLFKSLTPCVVSPKFLIFFFILRVSLSDHLTFLYDILHAVFSWISSERKLALLTFFFLCSFFSLKPGLLHCLLPIGRSSTVKLLISGWTFCYFIPFQSESNCLRILSEITLRSSPAS